MRELLQLMGEVNLALAGSVALVLAVRGPFGRRWGAHRAYALWSAPAAAALAVLAPRLGGPAAAPVARAAGSGLEGALATLWAVGVLVAVLVMVTSHLRFERRARAGRAGPALVGVLLPRVVMPADSATRWTPQELALVRAHERAHLDRGDARVNGLVAVIQCLCWFNPLVHWGAARLRFDQELACDAAVMMMQPGRRRLYAQAMLKAQAPCSASPVGCGWAAGSARGLEQRITALKHGRAANGHADAGALAVILLAAGVSWTFQPAQAGKPAPERVTVINLKPSGDGPAFPITPM